MQNFVQKISTAGRIVIMLIPNLHIRRRIRSVAASRHSPREVVVL